MGKELAQHLPHKGYCKHLKKNIFMPISYTAFVPKQESFSFWI